MLADGALGWLLWLCKLEGLVCTCFCDSPARVRAHITQVPTLLLRLEHRSTPPCSLPCGRAHSHCSLLPALPSLLPQIPMAEVQVMWTEVPGSKIRPTSMVHMALELAAIRAGYGLGLWRVRGEEELGKQQ